MQEFFYVFLGKWSYLGLFVILMAAGFGLPLPEDIPLVAAGWLVHRGGADLRLMIATGLVGVLLGDTILYLLGRQYGPQILERRWFRRMAKPWLVQRAEAMYAGHGAKIIFAARFMPGLRSVLFITAGIFRVPFWKFAAFDGFAAAISVPTWIWLSARFSGRVEEWVGEARLATYIVVGVLGAALLVWLVWEYYHNLRKRNAGRTLPGEATSGEAADTGRPEARNDGTVAASPNRSAVRRSAKVVGRA